ncbi:hypothetical protein QEZ54_18580 [Catellatospora sp. KI3]|uniref:hypothetical protein n=1 Tax=Catellatospora TaxID=53365 RepID=UPI001C2D0B13|nr:MULTISPECIES: hypothetical protein [Catellatospora]MBV1850158.1 hypothetical protein [Catellatospora tritici]MDI1462987.1 hypothetical protein [Catellatospora sp. KI3]
MAADEAATRAELAEVERLIADLRRSAEGIHEEIGNRDDGPGDPGDVSELFAETQEQEALLGELEQRRDDLRHRLDPHEP